MYEQELLIEKLQTLLLALERVPRRFESISNPADFYQTDEGLDKQDAICMILIAVGEELKNIDRKTDKRLFSHYPDIAWRGFMGLRDVLAHTYFQVDAEQLFNICKNDVPVLISAIRGIIADLESS